MRYTNHKYLINLLHFLSNFSTFVKFCCCTHDFVISIFVTVTHLNSALIYPLIVKVIITIKIHITVHKLFVQKNSNYF